MWQDRYIEAASRALLFDNVNSGCPRGFFLIVSFSYQKKKPLTWRCCLAKKLSPADFDKSKRKKLGSGEKDMSHDS